MAIFKGAGVAIVTPMKENGEINYEVLGALIEDQMLRRRRAGSLSLPVRDPTIPLTRS